MKELLNASPQGAPPPCGRASRSTSGWGRGATAACAIALLAIVPWANASADDERQRLECSATVDADTVAVGEAVSFTVDATGGRAPYSYDWSVPDANPDTAASRVLSVTYSAAGTYTGTVTVTDRMTDRTSRWRRGSSCTASATVTVTGGSQPGVCNIAVDPTSLAFGNVNVGSSSTLDTTLTNSGSGSCDVSLSLDPNGSADFAIVGSTSVNLGAGASATVSVSYTPAGMGRDSATLVASTAASSSPTNVALTGNGIDTAADCMAGADTSINSTAQNGCPDVKVDEQPQVANNSYSVLAINDLGMHCGDLDTRIASILPPFQVMLAQVIEKGSRPTLNPDGIDVYYSAGSNPDDPVADVFDGLLGNGDTYKTNFWDFPVPAGTYDPFYPAYNPFDPTQDLTPLAGPPFNVGADVGLPVPNVEDLYIGPDGDVNSGDESLSAVMHAMPGIAGPYTANDPQLAREHYVDKPFFVNFPFGYVAPEVNWYEAAGIPFAAFDDFGRENAYPLVRVEARNGATTLSTVDTVLPISGEASCMNCHTTSDDFASVYGDTTNHRTNGPTEVLATNSLPVATTADDPDIGDLPPRVSLEYAADINVLRLHDFRHGERYVSTACDTPGEDCLTTAPAPCDITQNGGIGDANCLTNQALPAADGGQGKPVVCQVCHYTPALDLAQLGPLAGPEGTIANGRNQIAHQSNSRVMHNHHGSLPGNLFPPIPPPAQNQQGVVTNQDIRITAMENSCYQCHPGTSVQCLRGAMFNGEMLCSDCHGDMTQVGADFSEGVSPENPGDFLLTLGNFYDPNSPQPRVPWANEPGCGSCHTGDFSDHLSGDNLIENTRDSHDNLDGIRLRQAYRIGDGKATPIVPTNKRFAEPEVPADFNGFPNPGAGNPQLYRVSTGHGGVMCEGCHGATHAEWPNANPNANDNQTAKQLQGHAGTIADCGTCHSSSPGDNLNGPHGLHRIAFDSTPWASGSLHERVAEGNFDDCATCHGGTSRSNSCGTVLSRALADRSFRGRTILKGEPVGCAVCHSGSYWDSTCATQ